MFEKEYTFSGRHADMVKKLTAQYDDDSNSKIFTRNVDVYIVAPLIGFLYGRRSSVDSTNDQSTKIFPEQLSKESTTLKYNYQLIILLHDNHLSFEEKLDKAFRYYGSVKNIGDEQLFNEFVLGGVEVLYEKIIEEATVAEDYLKNLYDFMEDFDSRFTQTVSVDMIIDLCKLAKDY